jgi:hypothetical protein
MEKQADIIYEKFNAQRKKLDAKEADEIDMEELKLLEDKIKQGK